MGLPGSFDLHESVEGAGHRSRVRDRAAKVCDECTGAFPGRYDERPCLSHYISVRRTPMCRYCCIERAGLIGKELTITSRTGSRVESSLRYRTLLITFAVRTNDNLHVFWFTTARTEEF